MSDDTKQDLPWWLCTPYDRGMEAAELQACVWIQAETAETAADEAAPILQEEFGDTVVEHIYVLTDANRVAFTMFAKARPSELQCCGGIADAPGRHSTYCLVAPDELKGIGGAM